MFPVYLQGIFIRSVSKNNAAVRKILVEHSDVIFSKIDQHLEKLYKENKGFPIFWNTVYYPTVQYYNALSSVTDTKVYKNVDSVKQKLQQQFCDVGRSYIRRRCAYSQSMHVLYLVF